MILSHRAEPLPSLNMTSYRAMWTHFKPKNMDFLANYFGMFWMFEFFALHRYPISSSSHSHVFLSSSHSRKVDLKKMYERTQSKANSLKLLTSYEPSRSKTLSARECEGFTFSPSGSR